MLDQKPFRDLAKIVDSFKDDRIWVYAEWIGKQYACKEDGVWLAGYHGILYDLTDEAIRACSQDTRSTFVLLIVFETCLQSTILSV